MDTSSTIKNMSIPDSTSVFPHISNSKGRETVSISALNNPSSSTERLTNVPKIAHSVPLSTTAYEVTTPKFDGDRLSPNSRSTTPESHLANALFQMTDMCRSVGQQHTTEPQSPEQIIPNIVVENPPISASTQQPPSLRKSWTRNACGKCIKAKHLTTHQKFCGRLYGGKTHNCREKECRRMLTALWMENFLRDEDCHHKDRAVRLKERLPTSEVLTLCNTSPQTNNCFTLSRNAFSQPRPEASRNTGSSLRKRTEQQNDSVMTERLASPGDSTAILHASDGFPEVGPTASLVSSINVNTELLHSSTFNAGVLGTYPDRIIQEGFVESNWLMLARNIAAYDHFVRGVTSKNEIRSKLEIMDTIAPLSDLPEIRQEIEQPGRFWHQSTSLLQALKGMFNVPASTSLRSGISLSSGQIRRLRFSYVLRATLAYILHQEVFSVEENGPVWKTIERCLHSVRGEDEGAATLQYCRLETLKLDAVKTSLECRAQQLAESIYCTLLPLSHWVEESPNNEKAQHLELLEKITHQSVYLISDLQAREGTFEIPWPRYGVLFDPDFYSVDSSQEDDVQNMDYETKKKQVIVFVLMPPVQRRLHNEESMLPYARGVVLLKEPYVGYRR